MKERIMKLLTVKSIVTLILTAVFAYMAITGVIGGGQFLTIFTVVVSFYFGTQAEKVNGALTGEERLPHQRDQLRVYLASGSPGAVHGARKRIQIQGP